MAREYFSMEYNDKDLTVKQEIIKQRKSIVEHPFGTIKRSMDSGYCITKGLRNVAGEFALTFLAYNLKRVINLIGGTKLIESFA